MGTVTDRAGSGAADPGGPPGRQLRPDAAAARRPRGRGRADRPRRSCSRQTGVARLTPKAPAVERGGPGAPAGDGPLRDRRDRRHHGRARHRPRDDRQRVHVGFAPPAAGARVARALPDERDAPAQRSLRRQRAGPRSGALRRPFRRPAGRRRSSRRFAWQRRPARCSRARSRTSSAGSSTCTAPATTCSGSARSSTSGHRDGEPLLFYTGRFGTLAELQDRG